MAQQPWNILPPREQPMDRHYEQGPNTTRKAYAACHLSWCPQGERHLFKPGTEVQGHLPADVLQACLADGRVTYDAPEE